jgi:hypothetical protein
LEAEGQPGVTLHRILPAFATADFAVTDLLMRDDAPRPQLAPSLPQAITHVWVASTWTTGRGMRWSPTDGWQYFDTGFRAAA